MPTILDRLYVSGSGGNEDRESSTGTVSSQEEPRPDELPASEHDVPRSTPMDDRPTSGTECPSKLRALRLAKNRRRLREQATRAFCDGDGNNKVVGTQAVLNRQNDEPNSTSKSGRCMGSLRKRKPKRHRKFKKTTEPDVGDTEASIAVKLQQIHLPEIGSGTGRYSRRDIRYRKSTEKRRRNKFGDSSTMQREITLDEVQKFFLHRNKTPETGTPAQYRLPRGVVHLEEITATHRKLTPTSAQANSPFTNLTSYGVKLLQPNTMDGFELRATAVSDGPSTRQLPSYVQNKLQKQPQKDGDARDIDDSKAHRDYPKEKKLIDIVAEVNRTSNEYDDVIRIPPLTATRRELTSYAIAPSPVPILKKKVIV
ncbi:hypothetical protein LSAT2_008739 [Lamellibrachia satsuma]|nr:hypothetical protein LSAT2_008739 [Lamellibrachia satsuma]